MGLSGLRGSEWVEWDAWFRSKASFPCTIDILHKEVTSCIFIVLNFCSNHSIHSTHSTHSIQANLRGLSGLEWVAWVRVG